MIEDDAPWPDDVDAPHEEEDEPKPHLQVVTARFRELIETLKPQPDPGVLAGLAKRKVGKGKDAVYVPDNTPLNVHNVLMYDPRWAGRIRWNDFAGEVEVRVPDDDDETRRPIDVMATMVVHWLECVYQIKTTEERVGRELNVVADFDRYSPVRDYLTALKWDKKPRLDRLMSHYLRAEDVPLHASLGRCWMVSAVARAFDPGCKVDTTLILVGEQGSGKSTAAKVLASPKWFSDSLLDIHSKDLFESIHGVWIYEFAELDAFSRSDWPKIKATLSSPADRYRRPYGKSSERRLRSVVFIGTTNRDDFLGDPTGSRRFWCVRVGASRIAELTADRDQLWAEAVTAFQRGLPWHLTETEAADLAASNRKFETPHPWSDVIADWMARTQVQQFRMADLLAECLGSQSRNPALDSVVVSGILRRMGWTSKQSTVGGVRSIWWQRPKQAGGEA